MSLNVPAYGGGYSTGQGTLIERLKQAQINAAMAAQAGVTNVAGATQGIDNSVVYSAEKEAYDKAMYDGNSCTDGKDDGKIGFFASIGNAIEGVGKAIVKGVKGMFTDAEGNFSLGKTLLSIGTIAATFIPVVGPVITCGLACYGIYQGTTAVVNAATIAANATSDAEAKQAWENIGSGAFTVVTSAYGLKAGASALNRQLNAPIAKGGSQMVQAIKAGKGGVWKGCKADFVNNAKGAWQGVKDVKNKITGKAKEYWNNPKQIGQDLKAANPYKKIKAMPGKIKDAYNNYKNSFIDKGVRKVNIADDMASVNIADDIATIKGAKIKLQDGKYTYQDSFGDTYIYNAKGKLTSYTKQMGKNTYTYDANGKLQTTSFSNLEGQTVTDGYNMFGRRNSRTYTDNGAEKIIKYSKFKSNNTVTSKITKTVNGKQVVETTVVKPDGTNVITQTSLDGKTTISTKTIKPDGTTTFLKDANGTTKTYNVGDTQFGYTKNHWYNRKKYTIDGNPTTTASQKWLSRGTNAYNWMMNQKSLGIAGPRFGQLTNINPNSVMYNNPSVQQAILTGYVSNRAGNGF